jgi:hypothetical protein
MSVVGGFSLLGRVMLGGDCRITYDGGKFQSDRLQKILKLADNTIIGFVGDDVYCAGDLLKAVVDHLTASPKAAVTVMDWLPQLFAQEYARSGSKATIEFLVGNVIEGKPTIISPGDLAKAREYFPKGSPDTGSALCLSAPPDHHAHVACESETSLYHLGSPAFAKTLCMPLAFHTIGSGADAVDGILKKGWAKVLAADVDDIPVVGGVMVGSLLSSFGKRGNKYVGGLVVLMDVGANRCALHGYILDSKGKPAKKNISAVPVQEGGIFLEGHRIVQHDLVSGKRLGLYLPWELRSLPTPPEGLFNNFR